MRLLKKFFAGLCLVIGLPITLLCTVELLNPDTPAEDKEGATAAIALLGLPPTAIGGWLLFSLRQQNQHQSQQLDFARDQLFLKLVQEYEGDLTVTKFALEAQIPIEDAKEYLDEKAQQLDARFEASDEGGIIYKFPV